MSRLSDEALEQIIQQQMPGHRILRREPSAEQVSYAGVDAVPASVNTNADAVSPDLEALKLKYLGSNYRSRSAGFDSRQADSSTTNDDSELVIVHVDQPQDSFDPGPGPKGVIIKDGKIIGQQG